MFGLNPSSAFPMTILLLRREPSQCTTPQIGSSAYRPFRIVVVRFGPAEQRHYAVAEILRDVPVKASDRLGRRADDTRRPPSRAIARDRAEWRSQSSRPGRRTALSDAVALRPLLATESTGF
jgi:hypothetical protein